MKTKTFLIALFFIGAALNSSNATGLTYNYDISAFKNEDNKIFIEFYYSVSQNTLKFLKTEKGFEADVFLSLEITNSSTGKQFVSNNFNIPVNVSDTLNMNRNENLLGQINFLLEGGKYLLKTTAKDKNFPGDSISYNDTLIFNNFATDKVSLSTVQLATKVEKSTNTNDIFYKNTLEVVPNPALIFGNNISKLFYYFEIYNLKPEYISGNYSIDVLLANPNNETLKNDIKNYKVKNDSKVETGSFDISDLKSGIYKLVVNINDDKNNKIIEKEKRFYVYNTDTSTAKNDGVLDNDYMASEYTRFTDEQLDAEFAYATYLMTDAGKSQYKKLNEIESKRRFLFSFWRIFNPNSKSSVNEFKTMYLGRIAYANKAYRFENKEGWLTDRGRVYCINGKPDDIERFPFETETKAYEIWHYQSIPGEGPCDFVFIDLSNDGGNYALVHSTKKGELRDDNWKDRLNLKK